MKTWNNSLTIDKTLARRVDEVEEDEIAPESSEFELKGGHKTNPIPYSAIHQTSEGPLVILKSPERGTYLPYNLSDQAEESELQLEKALENQEWLRWARDSLRDLSLTWQADDETFMDKYGNGLLIAFAAVLILVSVILQYQSWGGIQEALTMLAESHQ